MKFFNKKEVRKKEYFLAGILAIIVILCFWHYLKIKQKHRQKFIDQVSNFEISAEVLERIQIMSQIQGQDYIELLARYADKNNYRLQDIDILKNKKKINIKNWKQKESIKIYQQVLKDITYFPILKNDKIIDEVKPYFYENTWKVKRTYGGERLHFGTDIMDIEDERGRLPIVSMTSGVIEKIGWNEKGGWRVGIRAPHGAYFYYAHFFMYAPDLYEGMHVESGQLLGYMGDSGYGKKENTMGHFPVHLHLGILLTIDDREVWINPYEILRYLEKEFLF